VIKNLVHVYQILNYTFCLYFIVDGVIKKTKEEIKNLNVLE